jgi:hypothetical protein
MAHWCFNFDAEPTTLRHGLSEKLWLMQYQYSHGEFKYQGHPDQIASTTNNWRLVLPRIRPGDWLVAYLARPARFFAVGQVIEPRERSRYQGQPRHIDTVERTTAEHRHLHLDGVVRYSDTPAAYEDFTDPWHHRAINSRSGGEEVWRYPQRVDVEEWLHYVPAGVTVPGLNEVVGVGGGMTRAAFVIPADFYAMILERLRARATGTEEADGYEPTGEDGYEPTGEDARQLVFASIKARQGQEGFRNSLRERYGDTCVVTGCPLLALLDAAHICPFRGEKDNHPANGLLLRADIHTMFDLDLLGIEPETLRLSVHPDVRAAGYGDLEGGLLRCRSNRPSRASLAWRWERFQARLAGEPVVAGPQG